MSNPYKHPAGLFDRLMYPSLASAWDHGFNEGRKTSVAPEAKPAADVVYMPGEDSGFYIVQSEEVFCYRGADSYKRWANVAAFPDTELAEAEAKADEVYQEGHGSVQVRVIHVGKAVAA